MTRWLEDRKDINAGAGSIAAIPSVVADHGQDHDTWAQAITREGGSLAASTTASTLAGQGASGLVKWGLERGAGEVGGAAAAELGAETGGEAGMMIGSVIPGAGTVAGAAVGALAGGVVGFLASKGIEDLFG